MTRKPRNYVRVLIYQARAIVQVERFNTNATTCTDYVAKNRTTLYFCNTLFATCSNLICCKTVGLNVGGKMRNVAFIIISTPIESFRF